MKCKWEDQNMADRVRAVLEVAPDMRVVLDPNQRFHNVDNAVELTPYLFPARGPSEPRKR